MNWATRSDYNRIYNWLSGALVLTFILCGRLAVWPICCPTIGQTIKVSPRVLSYSVLAQEMLCSALMNDTTQGQQKSAQLGVELS